jgi:hypothetical protein
MRRVALLPLLLSGLFAQAGTAACIYPHPPEGMPDGKTATFDEMVAAQKVVRQFDADITAYTACLDMELQSALANPELDDARKADLQSMEVQKNNAAVDEAQSVVDRFNEQLRAFKEAHKKN